MVWIALSLFCVLGALAVALPWLRRPASEPRGRGFFIGMAVIGVSAVIAFAIYAKIGAPSVADLPLASRERPINTPLTDLIGQAEARLRANPRDAQGWRVIAPIYRQVGRLDDAVEAFDRALALVDRQAPVYADLLASRIETLLLQTQGKFSVYIKERIAEAVSIAPNHPRIGFLQALLADQTGTNDDAIQAWDALIDRLEGSETPILEIARQRLAALKGETAQSPAVAATPEKPMRGPTLSDVEAAQELSADQRTAMIEGMVAGLAARLEDEPDDIDGWERLIRSYMVLNKTEEATAALAKAKAQMAGKPAALARLSAFDRQLGQGAGQRSGQGSGQDQ